MEYNSIALFMKDGEVLLYTGVQEIRPTADDQLVITAAEDDLSWSYPMAEILYWVCGNFAEPMGASF